MGLVESFISKYFGLLSWVPGFVFIIQALLSVVLFIFILVFVIFMPGKLLKITSLIIGFLLIIIVWFV